MARSKANSWIIAREGLPFIAFGLIPLLIALFFKSSILAALSLIGVLFTALFFRNPPRQLPAGISPSSVLSPADGRIVEISEVEEPRFVKRRMMRLSIFMSPFNVHVNRSPVKGKVVDRIYLPGKFYLAERPKASVLNEQNAWHFELDDVRKSAIICVQIAGFFARRIVWYFERGASLLPGERIGLIRFGSRVDLYLPLESQLKVSIGERVVGGETIIGELPR